MNEKKIIYTTRPTRTKPFEVFRRDPNGNTRRVSDGIEEKIGKIIYCPLEEANEILNRSVTGAQISDKTPQEFFRDLIFYARQMGNFPGGIIIYEDGNETTEEGLPKLKRSYSLVEKIKETKKS